MLIIVSREVLLDPENDPAIVQLFDKCYRAVLPEDEECLEKLLERRQHDRQRIKAAINTSRLKLQHNSQPNCNIRVVKSPSRPNESSLGDALQLSRTRYSLFLENDETDRGFLLWVLPSTLSSRVRELENEGKLVLEHRGGFDGIKKAFSHEKYSSSISLGMCGALFDSDGLHIGCTSSAIDDVIKVAKAAGADLHVLPRRTIENYITTEDLRSFAEAVEKGIVTAHPLTKEFEKAAGEFDGLSTELKHFLHLKEGFKKDVSVYKAVEENRVPNNYVGFDVNAYKRIWQSKRELQRLGALWDGFREGITQVFKLERKAPKKEDLDIVEIHQFVRTVIQKAQ